MCTIKIIKSCTNINACVPMRNKYLNLNLNMLGQPRTARTEQQEQDGRTGQ
jgi:hypothetical protein